jgi:cob(I)alamin adenosyltransferase
MKEARDEVARNLMRLGDLDGASEIAEAEIERVGDRGDTTAIWRLRFARAQVLEAHGHADEALKYLESLVLPLAEDIESCASLKMHRGFYSGLFLSL